MELLRVALMVALLLTNAFCQQLDVNSWREGIGENNWPSSEVIEDIIMRMTRNPGPHQYLKLSGKKDFIRAKTQTARKRHKFQTFVGLMGKRSFEDQEAQ